MPDVGIYLPDVGCGRRYGWSAAGVFFRNNFKQNVGYLVNFINKGADLSCVTIMCFILPEFKW